MQTVGLHPIVDPLHHTSFPDWLEGGLANPDLPRLYTRFLARFTERYPWVRDYTLINEPLPTTLFCSYTGMWYPHGTSDHEFVQMLTNVARTICEATAMLRSRCPGFRSVHIDTCESHRGLDSDSARCADFANHRRFLIHDLILGRIDAHHPLAPYLRQHGFSDTDMRWFQAHPAGFDILGLDYYHHSEMEWICHGNRHEIRWPVEKPRGFAAVSRDYYDRFGVPVILAETNLRGTVADRISWLRFMHEQYDSAREEGVDLRGFCWYPSIDSTDWSNCCTRLTHEIDPQGIWMLGDCRWRRIGSELSDCYSALARGEITWRDLPAYRFQGHLTHTLKGYIRLMRHWDDWRDVELPEAEAA